ncbi:caffeic acid 3-O-methyltransferase isoform X1 [Arachis hypogaea]|uniref:caffeic acid 3-O-methyltransferase isoform X1 n=1 Tax=Arachis hypogaea TaxID=3818 RepID=UPI003B221447
MALASHDSDAKLEKQEDDAFMFAQMACSVVVPMAVRTTIELGVFEIIAKEGEGAKLSAKDIVDRIGSNNPEAASMLDRVLRLLASHSLLSCSVVEDPESSNNLHHRLLYSLSPVSKYFVTDADGVSWGPSLAHLLDKVLYPCWYLNVFWRYIRILDNYRSELKGAILEGGIPFNRVYGMNMFEYANIDPRFNEIFNKAMLTSSTISMKRILDVYKGFDHINKLVDVGGGLGATLNLITSKYPNIQGVNFDLPHVIENAPIYAGVEHIGGDMFESVPNGDAIFIKNILHDWDDEGCLKILKNCRKAIPNDGKVIVVDKILPAMPEQTDFAKMTFRSDVFMMIQMSKGKERTLQDFMHLAKASGFSSITLICNVSSLWVMEFFNQ